MDKQINKRFKQAIRSTGLTHEEIAETMNVKEHEISNMSAGRKKVTVDFAIELEKNFYINPCWLFFGRERMTANFNIEETGAKDLTNEEISAKLRHLTEKLKELEDGYKKD